VSDEHLQVRTLTQGGQRAEDVAAELVAFVAAATRSLDLALYSIHLTGDIGGLVSGAIRAAAARGVAVRIAYNDPAVEHRDLVSPPPATRPELLADLGVPLLGIPGGQDLMHHKYVVRDGDAVWCGSANWSIDSWTLQENVIVVVENRALAAAYAANFAELWRHGSLEDSGAIRTRAIDLGVGRSVRPWFCPGQGEQLSHRIATAIGRARQRVRIASPVLTAGAILGTLAEVTSEGRVDLAGVCDATQIADVVRQWNRNPSSAWKLPLLEQVLRDGRFSGKRSTAWGADSVHDFMHAKVVVADDLVFVGSFNLSRSGEGNAENMLEFVDRGLADRMTRFVDEVRARYPAPVAVPH